jgi:hypothetical protein
VLALSAAQVVAPEVDEVGLEEIAVWLKRSKVEARGERAQGQQDRRRLL